MNDIRIDGLSSIILAIVLPPKGLVNDASPASTSAPATVLREGIFGITFQL